MAYANGTSLDGLRFLTGDEMFTVKEIEVLRLRNKNATCECSPSFDSSFLATSVTDTDEEGKKELDRKHEGSDQAQFTHWHRVFQNPNEICLGSLLTK
jgi:hypothetical protein